MRTPMITPEGMQKIKDEIDHLWRVERPETTRKVSWAASLGDRSENADNKALRSSKKVKNLILKGIRFTLT